MYLPLKGAVQPVWVALGAAICAAKKRTKKKPIDRGRDIIAQKGRRVNTLFSIFSAFGRFFFLNIKNSVGKEKKGGERRTARPKHKNLPRAKSALRKPPPFANTP